MEKCAFPAFEETSEFTANLSPAPSFFLFFSDFKLYNNPERTKLALAAWTSLYDPIPRTRVLHWETQPLPSTGSPFQREREAAEQEIVNMPLLRILRWVIVLFFSFWKIDWNYRLPTSWEKTGKVTDRGQLTEIHIFFWKFFAPEFAGLGACPFLHSFSKKTEAMFDSSDLWYKSEVDQVWFLNESTSQNSQCCSENDFICFCQDRLRKGQDGTGFYNR